MSKNLLSLPGIEERCLPLVRIVGSLGTENGIFAGNSLEIITEGSRKRELLLEDIRSARRYIHLEYFRFGNDKAGREVRDLLMEKAAQGVEVRLLNNNLSGFFSIPSSYFRKMGAVEVIPFTHIRHGVGRWLYRINHQQHRKAVIIDGEVAYTGGMNLNDNYFYRWKDTHLRITGPAVAGLEASFALSWRGSGGRFTYVPEYYIPAQIPAGEAPLKGKTVQLVSDNPEVPVAAMLEVYCWLLDHARQYVYMHTPYFVPPKRLVESLKAAARRGVDVRLMLPRRVDTFLMSPVNRTFYAECRGAGVRILEEDGPFNHSKTLVWDDSVALVGATNLDNRSFHLNYELDTLVYDRETALLLKERFLSEAALAQEWEGGRGNLLQRLFGCLVRTVAPLL